jgi:DNA-binding SARP family transcriptional activator
MTDLRIRLLGVPEVSRSGQAVALRRRSSVALLAYLATTGRHCTRPMLATFLAGEASEEQAQKRVSNTLSDLRTALGEHLLVTRQWVAFDRERPHWLDVAEFEALVASREPPRATAAAALALHGGEFLTGVDVNDAPEFDEWLRLQRERLHQALVQALQAALPGYVRDAPASAATTAAGIATARRLLELEPWNEDGHQALMTLLARNGQRGAALRQYALCRQVLADELGIEPAPETAALAARLRAGPRAVPHNLPAPAAAFVGRQAELALLTGRLADPACRLVTLVGLGGIGKSALAVEAARRFVAPDAGLGEPFGEASFPDGVFVVSLGEETSESGGAPLHPEPAAARIADAIARAVGADVAAHGDRLAAVAAHLHVRRVLLVVDGLERFLAGAGALARLLKLTAGVKVLVTSRTRLRLCGETVCDVRGLRTPEAAADLERSTAGRLFLEEAARVRPAVRLGAAERAAAAEVCRLLGGHPLALLTAAGCLRGVTCADLVADLRAGRGLPATCSTALGHSARRDGLQAALAAAWAQLGEEERTALRRLAVFEGPVSRETAFAVGAGSVHLLGLVDAGVLERQEDGRYAVNALVHRYRFAADRPGGVEDGVAAGSAAPRRVAPGATQGGGSDHLSEALCLLAASLARVASSGTAGAAAPGAASRRGARDLADERATSAASPAAPQQGPRRTTRSGCGARPAAGRRRPPRGGAPCRRTTTSPRPGCGAASLSAPRRGVRPSGAVERRSRAPPEGRPGAAPGTSRSLRIRRAAAGRPGPGSGRRRRERG